MYNVDLERFVAMFILQSRINLNLETTLIETRTTANGSALVDNLSKGNKIIKLDTKDRLGRCMRLIVRCVICEETCNICKTHSASVSGLMTVIRGLKHPPSISCSCMKKLLRGEDKAQFNFKGGTRPNRRLIQRIKDVLLLFDDVKRPNSKGFFKQSNNTRKVSLT